MKEKCPSMQNCESKHKARFPLKKFINIATITAVITFVTAVLQLIYLVKSDSGTQLNENKPIIRLSINNEIHSIIVDKSLNDALYKASLGNELQDEWYDNLYNIVNDDSNRTYMFYAPNYLIEWKFDKTNFLYQIYLANKSFIGNNVISGGMLNWDTYRTDGVLMLPINIENIGYSNIIDLYISLYDSKCNIQPVNIHPIQLNNQVVITIILSTGLRYSISSDGIYSNNDKEQTLYFDLIYMDENSDWYWQRYVIGNCIYNEIELVQIGRLDECVIQNRFSTFEETLSYINSCN